MATTWTDADPRAFLSSITPAGRRRDAEALLDLMREVSGQEPRMFGPSIVGFGEYSYQYESGRRGIAPAAAFSPRKAATVIYLPDGIGAHTAALAKLGPHTTGTGCLNIKDLTKTNLVVLRRILRTSFKTITAATHSKRSRES